MASNTSAVGKVIEAVMPKGVEHRIEDMRVEGGALAVIEAVMPKGVEHLKEQRRAAERERRRVIEAVMPKGVEHYACDATLFPCNMGDRGRDAERR